MTVEMERAAEVHELPETLRHVPAILSEEFGDVDVQAIERSVAQTYRQLAEDARVVSFLPILTEKVVRDRLVTHRVRYAPSRRSSR